MKTALSLDIKLYDEAAERAILGAMLAEPAVIPSVRAQLNEEDLFFEEHRLLFSILQEIFETHGTNWDEVVLNDFLYRKGLSHKLSFDWILGIYEEAAPLNTLETACRIVRDKSIQRRVLDIITRYALPSLKRGELSLSELISKLSNLLIETSIAESYDALSLINEFLTKLSKSEDEIPRDIFSTGYLSLEGILDGIPLGSYVLIGARPRVGKTSFALNLALNLQKHGSSTPIPTLLVSLEMNETELTKRLLSLITGIPYRNIKNESLKKSDVDKASEKILNLLEELKNIYVLHKPAMDIYELEGQITKHKIEHGIEVVFIDYLQLLRFHGQMGVSYEVVSQISQQLCAIARRNRILLVALVQLSREAEKKRPTLSDLKGSGQLEQDADVVMLLHREALSKKKPTKDELKRLEIIVAKNRFGEVGVAELEFDGDTQAIRDPGIRSEIGVQDSESVDSEVNEQDLDF